MSSSGKSLKKKLKPCGRKPARTSQSSISPGGPRSGWRPTDGLGLGRRRAVRSARLWPCRGRRLTARWACRHRRLNLQEVQEAEVEGRQAQDGIRSQVDEGGEGRNRGGLDPGVPPRQLRPQRVRQAPLRVQQRKGV